MRFQRHYDPVTGNPSENTNERGRLRRASKCVCCRCCSTAEYSHFSFCESCGDKLGPWSTSTNAIACLHRKIRMIEEIKEFVILKQHNKEIETN